jgi:RNA polymerase sigma factor (sigma-70 family)
VRAKQGDLQAFAEIVRRFRDMACGYALSVLRDPQLAQDVAQEAFIDAYAKLGDLREPAAFAGWLRRIVFKHCDRATRGKQSKNLSLESVAEVASADPRPDAIAERRDMDRKVLQALQELSDKERTATTLYYMNGYSQAEVAEFLEVPVGTVKTRLRSARAKLRERMVGMVKDTLHGIAPDERFSQKVIARLLGRPNLMELKGHPVHEAWCKVKETLPEFEVVEAQEVLSSASPANTYYADNFYRPSKDEMLCNELLDIALPELARRKSPMKILIRGRVFLHNLEHMGGVPVRHSVLAMDVGLSVGRASLEAMARRITDTLLGDVKLIFEDWYFHWLDPCLRLHVGRIAEDNRLAGCGVLAEKTLRDRGHDPSQVGGYMVEFSLEKAVQLARGIADVRELW